MLVLRAACLAHPFFGQGEDPIRGSRQNVIQFAQIGRRGQQVALQLGLQVPMLLILLRTVGFRYLGQVPFVFKVRQRLVFW